MGKTSIGTRGITASGIPSPVAIQVIERGLWHLAHFIHLAHRRGIIANPEPYARKLDLTLDWSPRRTRSNGGINRNLDPVMSLAMRRVLRRADMGRFEEYPSFQNDPVIGTLTTDSVDEIFACLLAHEFSHVVQFTAGIKHPEMRGGRKLPWETARKAHGDLFRSVYREFREHYVNCGKAREGPRSIDTIRHHLER